MTRRNDEMISYGPEENDLLYLQENHRSNYVFNGAIDDLFRQRHNNSPGFSHNEEDERGINLHDRVLEQIYDMGFFGVFRCGYIGVDPHLVTALIERWRPETHTFHFPVGETTITLEDVAVIWGLPIRGDPIIGKDAFPEKYNSWSHCCEVMLGFAPNVSEIRGSRINMSAIRSHLKDNPIDKESPHEHVLQLARCTALLLIGAFMCPDTSGNKVSLIYLCHMETTEQCRNHSWGSAVLAFLYHELCGASVNSCPNQNIGGALQLLQIWAWIRISCIRPLRLSERVKTGPTILSNGRILPMPPHGVRWITYFSWTQTASHNVRIFRDMFDRLTPNEFVWRPYCMDWPEIVSLPEECGRELWRSTCPLIHYSIIETLHIERVTRQFGIVQVIPPNPPRTENETLHKLTRKGRGGQDWVQFHHLYMTQWYSATQNEITGDPATQEREVVVGYFIWYRKKTRKLISPPNPSGADGYRPNDHGADGYRPIDHGAWNLVANGLTCMLDDFKTITNYNDPRRFKEMVDSHTQVIQSLQSVVKQHAVPQNVTEEIRRKKTSRRR